MACVIQIRRDTATNWTTTNPTLAQGELGLETDTLKFKVGDGVNDWNTLSYLNLTAEETQDVIGGILTDTASVDFTYDDGADEIRADVLPAGVDHDQLANFVTNEHLDHSSILINPGTGLTGGGDITTSRTLTLADTAVTIGTYGDADSVSQITVDQQGRITSASDVNISITASAVTDFDTQVQTNQIDELAAPTGDLNLNSQKIINLGTPSAGTDAVNKNYVDGVAQGIQGKTAVRLATTAIVLTHPITGLFDVDGITPVAGDRILVRKHNSAKWNGVYIAAVGTWQRADDFDTWDEHVSAFVFVEEGTQLKDTGWLCTIDSGGTLDTDPIQWVQFSQAGTIDGLNTGTGDGEIFRDKLGTDLRFRTIRDTTTIDVTTPGDHVDLDVIPGGVDHDLLLNFVANEHIDHSSVSINAGTGLSGGGDITTSRTIDLANTAVSPGSYGDANSISTFTVDAQGRLTAAGEVDVDIPSTQINDFDEAVQDVVGAMMVTSLSISPNYGDPTNNLEFNLILSPTSSISILPSGVQLTGDQTAPGNDFFYGTNDSGVKGWYFQPVRIEQIGGNDHPVYTDTTKGNKVLTVATHSITFSDASLSPNAWMNIGAASDAATGYVPLYDATIVGATYECEDDGTVSRPLNLWINTTNTLTLFTTDGSGGVQAGQNTTLNVDITTAQLIRIRAGTAGGPPIALGDIIVTLYIKWRV